MSAVLGKAPPGPQTTREGGRDRETDTRVRAPPPRSTERRPREPVGHGLEVARAPARAGHEVPDRPEDDADHRLTRPRSSAAQPRGTRARWRRRSRSVLVEVEQEQGCHPDLCRERGAGRERERPRQESQPFGDRRGERDHARRGGDRELQADRPDERRIHHEQHEDGTGKDRPRAPRPPEQDAGQREPGHHPGTHHRRLGAGEYHEERDRSQPEGEPRPTRQPERRPQRHDRRQHHRDVATRDHEQV
jgi:hypothetical protein